MNKNNVLNIANGIFSNVTSINDDLYKGELFIDSDKPAGVYYLDFSDNVNKIDFKEYQENLLAKEYFNNRGSLQWNYYLLLFQDRFDQKKKREIERNDRYARKFIFTEAEFQDFFKLESSNSLLNADIVLEWKKKLDTVDLQEVYSNAPVSTAIDRFNENKTEKKAEKKQNSIKTTDAIKIDQIKKLVLTDKYRSFPIDRNFEFKKVNLIKGINGVGKTSLFEAIELIVCGKTKRNPGRNELEGAIEAIFNNPSIEKYMPSITKHNETYRKRDLLWYSNDYSRENNLHISFNRYNFFNSDAAYSFSTSNNESEIKDALFNLVLGSEYNYITERSGKFYEYIKAEFNRVDKETKNSKQIILDSDKIINSPDLTSNFNLIKQNLIENLNNLKVKNSIQDIEKNYMVVEELNNKVKSIIEKIKEDSIYTKSLKEIDNRIKLQITLQKLLETAINAHEVIVNKINGIQIETEKTSKKASLIIECNKYFADKRLFEIEGLKAKHDNIIQQLNRIKQADEALKGINIDNFKINNPIAIYLNEKNDELKKLKNEVILIDNSLKEQLNKLGKAEKVIKEIKLLGQAFLNINNNATECPLCQSRFKEDELKARIAIISQKENSIEAEQTQVLHDKRIKLNSTIEKLGAEVNCANKIQTAHLILSNEDIGKKSLLDIVTSIQKNRSNELKLNETEKQLNDLMALMLSFNVSETEFGYLKGQVNQNFEPIKFTYENRDEFVKIGKELTKEIADNKAIIEKFTEEKLELISKLKKNFGIDADTKADIKTIKNSILVEGNKITKAKDHFNKLSELLNIGESDSIDDLDLTSTILSKNINTLKSELKNQFEIDAAKKRKQDAEKYVKNSQEKFTRLKAAKSTLESLTSGDGSEQMEQFFNQNLAEIIDVFKTIHVPKEFVNIQFHKEELYLIDTDNKKRKISEISTGQRSALALSIFISLNRKLKNGPNIIMFDDPVSYIDDFNALSFLDFLRYFVLKENRQIFFATASTRLASLFEKKFQFLENDFKTWTLNREPN